MLRAEDLVGSWSLVRFVAERRGKDPVFPMGEGAQGQLLYTANGRMSATLSAQGRAPLDVARLESFAKASVASKAAAFDSYLSYVGRFEVQDTSVVHFVELASVPNIVGAAQRRQVTLEGDVLTLRYAVGEHRHNVLVWKRVVS